MSLNSEHMFTFLMFSAVGSLEDWDLAVQKTESRLNRVNEQRAKVGAITATLCWTPVWFCCFQLMLYYAVCQVAEKEATVARQEEDRAEQRRKAKSEKKTQKKLGKDVRAGNKRKAQQHYEDNWNDSIGR